MNKQGTREALRNWLLSMYRMTYTRYCHLPTQEKLAIQKEYRKPVKQTCKSTVVVVEPKEAS